MRTRFLGAKIGVDNLLVKKQQKNLLQQKDRVCRQAGFTLVEMIVVLGIIALLSSGMLLAFSRMSNQSFIDNQMAQIKSLIISYREKLRKGECENMELLFSNYPPASVTAKCLGVAPVQDQVRIQGVALDIKYKENPSSAFLTKDAFYLKLSNSKAGVLQLTSGSTTVAGSSVLIGDLDSFQILIKLTKNNVAKEFKINKSTILYGYDF